MPANQQKTNKLSIYLIKAAFQRLEDIVDSDRPTQEIPGVGDFIFGESHPHPPRWVNDFFGSTLSPTLNIFTSSAKGVLIAPIQDGSETIRFAIAFGVGRHLLKDGVVEERFGLKVVLNSVQPASFRSIDKTTLGSVPKHSHEQMSRDVAPTEFGIDIEQDLISSVTGKSDDRELGITISGRDALSVSVKADVTNIADFLHHCLNRFRSTDYKQAFDWIDQIAEVRDLQLEKTLTDMLIHKLIARDFNKLWMAVPEVVNWSDVAGFRYGKPKRSELHGDLDISTFLASLNSEQITLDTLKRGFVFMISAASDDIADRWPPFRCMYAEIDLNANLYVLNNGKWYAIARGFTDQVLADFNSTTKSTITLPDCTVSDEGEYNLFATASVPGSCCMDGKVVPHGGGHSKVEFCDLYTSDKRIVHIKRYGGSSVLSHLFSQGVVSGELFVGDGDFREKVNAQLPAERRLSDPSLRPNTSEYEIVYGIISNDDGPLDIPFFSKVSLRNARRRLSNFGYHVAIKKIQMVEA